MSSGESVVGCQRSLSWYDVHKTTHYCVHKGGLADRVLLSRMVCCLNQMLFVG